MAVARRSIGLTGFLLRWVLALVLVFATFNPTGYSYFHWVQSGFADQQALKVLTGLMMVALYAIAVRATLRSIGVAGAALVLAIMGSIVWLMSDLGVLSFEDPGVFQWLVLIGISLVLGVGLSWSLIRRAITGQLDVDDVDQE